MLIRTEAPADILVIDRLLKEVFETEAEANLVMKLREQGQCTLSLVACTDEGEVVGHLFFSPVMVEGQDINWQGLAPLAVAKEHQGTGIGTSLIEEAKQMLVDFGYPAVVVLGDNGFYQRTGFETAATHQLRCQWEVPEEAFMVLALQDGVLASPSGLVEYHSVFNEL